MAPPPGYTGLLIADTRRAQQWKLGLSRAGFESTIVDTKGVDTEKGDCQVCVASEDAGGARGFMTEVLRGDVSLPHVSAISPTAVKALVGVFVTVGAAVVAYAVFG